LKKKKGGADCHEGRRASEGGNCQSNQHSENNLRKGGMKKGKKKVGLARRESLQNLEKRLGAGGKRDDAKG